MSDFRITKNNIGEFEKILESVSIRALTMCGMQAERSAKIKCPWDTGFLRNSITYAIGGQSPAISTYKDNPGKQVGTYSGSAPDDGGDVKSVYLGTNIEYAQYVENGTSKMAARPFIRPAIADNTEKFKTIIQSEMKKG